MIRTCVFSPADLSAASIVEWNVLSRKVHVMISRQVQCKRFHCSRMVVRPVFLMRVVG